jgi:hypothetical protein
MTTLTYVETMPRYFHTFDRFGNARNREPRADSWPVRNPLS